VRSKRANELASKTVKGLFRRWNCAGSCGDIERGWDVG
jgi:hypothetical protein